MFLIQGLINSNFLNITLTFLNHEAFVFGLEVHGISVASCNVNLFIRDTYGNSAEL